jgi:hypothetical protein
MNIAFLLMSPIRWSAGVNQASACKMATNDIAVRETTARQIVRLCHLCIEERRCRSSFWTGFSAGVAADAKACVNGVTWSRSEGSVNVRRDHLRKVPNSKRSPRTRSLNRSPSQPSRRV